MYFLKDITWRLDVNNNDGLSRGNVERTLERAFGKWEAVCNLNFYKKSYLSTDPVDITVLFVEGDHGDGYKFNGKDDGITGHYFYAPPAGGG